MKIFLPLPWIFVFVLSVNAQQVEVQNLFPGYPVEIWVAVIGALFFGAVVGWLTHNVYQKAELINVPWLASLIGAIGGGAIMAIFPHKTPMFGAYCIGLGLSFFLRAMLHPLRKAVEEQMALENLKDTERKNAKRARRKIENIERLKGHKRALEAVVLPLYEEDNAESQAKAIYEFGQLKKDLDRFSEKDFIVFPFVPKAYGDDKGAAQTLLEKLTAVINDLEKGNFNEELEVRIEE